MIPDRTAILARCRDILVLRKAEYERELRSLDQAAAAETKSSAGDKYETAREMIAQSRNLIQHNLAEAEAGLDALERMAKAPLRPKVGFGSLVETGTGWHLVGVSLGELEILGMRLRMISLASPLGAALKGKGAGDRFPFMGADMEILQVPI
ncbi:MAG: hypothetical protein JWP91_3626 [Fibrobacteres bacterium]|nr:hypothetical protein [Fibrobacterota bacterium]